MPTGWSIGFRDWIDLDSGKNVTSHPDESRGTSPCSTDLAARLTDESEVRRLTTAFRDRVRILEELRADSTQATAFTLDVGFATLQANRETVPREFVQKAEQALAQDA